MSETTNEPIRPERRFERSDRAGRSTLFRPRQLASHEALKRAAGEAKESEAVPPLAPGEAAAEKKAGLPPWPFIAGAAMLMLIAVVATGYAGYRLGQASERAAEHAAAQRIPALVSEEQMLALNRALQMLRSGNPSEAITILSDLKSQSGSHPSVAYLLALAGLQSGDRQLASTAANESISLKERVSDSLALLAVVETQKASDRTQMAMVDPRRRAESFLREAMAVDPANPYPHFELATLLRYQGNRQEALQEIEAAKARLNPMDSHLVMDITSRLLRLESLAAVDLPPQQTSTNDPRELLPAAYAAMKRGDFDQAADLLRKTQALMDRELFIYLINDPAMRRFAKEPKLAEFYSEK
jgi:tetratricopeptide (TPR) repeat protein